MTIEFSEEERSFLIAIIKNHRDYYAVLTSRSNQEHFRFFDGLCKKLQPQTTSNQKTVKWK